jgi:hypothetical protein
MEMKKEGISHGISVFSMGGECDTYRRALALIEYIVNYRFISNSTPYGPPARGT